MLFQCVRIRASLKNMANHSVRCFAEDSTIDYHRKDPTHIKEIAKEF